MLVDGDDVTPHSPRLKALIASLAMRCGQVISVDRLADELWPALPADRARRVVQVRIAEVRKLLAGAGGGSVLEFVAPGYRLTVPSASIDLNRFLHLVERAQRETSRADPVTTTTVLREALGLWRGDALVDVRASSFLEDEADRLEQLRLAVIEDRIDAELADGCHHRLVAELKSSVASHPLREHLSYQLIVALYRCGRQAEALRACTQLRRVLIDEAGLDPGRALQSLEQTYWSRLPASTGTRVPRPHDGTSPTHIRRPASPKTHPR